LNTLIKYILLLTITMAFWNCSGSKPEQAYDYEDHLSKGKAFIEKKKYLRAQEELSQLVVRSMHTDIGDDALFYLGEAYFLNKEYIMAISEYDRLIRKMGFSEYVEEARWKICESYIALSPKYFKDQEYSLKALEKAQEFLDDYPYSEFSEAAKEKVEEIRGKLGKKNFESGILYTKLSVYDSAILSFENVLNLYYDTEYADLARLNIIKSLCKMNDFEKADEKYLEFSSNFKDKSIQDSAKKYLENAKSKSKKLK